jgi:hypothetical protein
MAAATNPQVQAFADARVRPHCELARSVALALTDDIAAIDDIYQNISGSPDWVDANPNHLPHTMTPADMLAWNAFIHTIRDAIVNDPNYPVILKLCRSPI